MPPRNVAQTMMRIWALAGMIGMCLAVSLAAAQPFEGLSRSANALIAIALGWAAMLCFAPWRQLLVLSANRKVVLGLTRRIRRLGSEKAGESIRRLKLDRPDELGELSRAIHDALAGAITARREKKRLQRNIDDTIRKETNRATHRLRREATTDPLTGLQNRRALEHHLAELFSEENGNRRRNDTVVMMLLDMDRFKRINDTLGHDVGDQCLAFLGNLVRSTVRHDDCAIRLGGDEFAVLMPTLTIPEAEKVADRITTLFRQMPWSHAIARPSLSIGLASARCCDKHGADILMKQADRALYQSKDDGRDRLTVFEEQAEAA